MKRKLICIISIFTVAAGLAMAKDKGGPISGIWDCQAHGDAQGDVTITLYLEQNKEMVDGRFSSSIGQTEISSGSFKRNMLEIHIDTPQGPYILMAKYSKGTLSGTWSSDTEKGTWEGKKQTPARH